MENGNMDIKKLLEVYFKQYVESLQDKNEFHWSQSLACWIAQMRIFKKEIKNVTLGDDNDLNNIIKNVFGSGENERKSWKIENLDDLVRELFFRQDAGAGNIGQGAAFGEEGRNKFLKTIKDNLSNFIEIFKETDVCQAYTHLHNIYEAAKIDKDLKAAKIRFLRLVFPDSLTPNDPYDQIYEIHHIIENKFGQSLPNQGCECKCISNINSGSERYKKGCEAIKRHICLTNLLSDFDFSSIDSFNNKRIENSCVDSYEKKKKKALKQTFFWELRYILDNQSDMKKSIIYYGSPGTGKTFEAKKLAKRKFIDWKLRMLLGDTNAQEMTHFVQFHLSFSYEDFIEGYKPDGKGGFVLGDGVFKAFCKKAGRIERKLWKNDEFKKKFLGKSFSEITVGELEDKDIRELELSEDFKHLSNYKNMTLDDVIQPAFFIIDEINRAELSKVFGELMYALEYRGYEGKIATPYSKIKRNDEEYYFEEDGQDWFFVPHNVYIIGTMNTIDRSVDIFDFAMRRRFEWQEFEPNYDLIRNFMFKDDNSLNKHKGKLADSLEKLNTKIAEKAFLGPDYRIGHAYILAIKTMRYTSLNLKDLKERIWEWSIKPLLQEYLRGLADSRKREAELNEFKNVFMN